MTVPQSTEATPTWGDCAACRRRVRVTPRGIAHRHEVKRHRRAAWQWCEGGGQPVKPLQRTRVTAAKPEVCQHVWVYGDDIRTCACGASEPAARDDSQSLAEFVRSWPDDAAWVGEQIAAGVCPNCGDKYETTEDGRGYVSRCHPVISSCWCATIRRHIVRPERRAA